MAWFRYLNEDGGYVYPNLRKKIIFPVDSDSGKQLIKEDILKNSWIFVNVKDLNVDIYQSLTKVDLAFVKTDEVDNDSYLVVYESKSSEDYNSIPVVTQIVGDLLYFKAAEDHLKNIDVNKQYSLYYKTPYLKLIKKVVNSIDYQQCEESQAEFISSDEDVDIFSHIRDLNSNNHYNLSFINNQLYWDSGVSQKPGASLIGTFTGPKIQIYCDKGPDYGKFKIKITAYGSDLEADNIMVYDWQSVDLYSENNIKNSEVFSKTNLLYKNYVFEIVSENKNINIKKYGFSLNNYLTLSKEEISPTLFGRVISGSNL